jgi:hypothetical protein
LEPAAVAEAFTEPAPSVPLEGAGYKGLHMGEVGEVADP